jgi:tRNA (guanine26-N2/guanine27-N2)-dimethyltransferase
MKPAPMRIGEGSALIEIPQGVFYNPEMEFCRDVSALVMAAAAKRRASLCDSMCASGIRGVRYALESGVSSVTFVDASPEACAAARKNAAKNGLKRFCVVLSELNRFFSSAGRFDVIEIDPFGSPAPYLHNAMRTAQRNALLSVTATDVAVLCGAHADACVKNYAAKPLNNEYCHETAARILLGKMAREAAERNAGIKPLLTLSHRHYIKTFARLAHGAKNAVESMRSLGFFAHCSSCMHRELRKGIAPALPEKCPECAGQLQRAGPLWLGALWDKKTVNKAAALNEKAGYKNSPAIARTLALMLGECEAPASYYSVHLACRKLGITPPKLDAVIAALKRAGFAATRTHFADNCIRTDASAKQFCSVISSL